jgi:hypothetical protein
MPGGLLQIKAYGAQDFYLTSNPQISFFKTVYRRYTNFSMDYYRLNPDGNIGLNDQETVTYKFKIDRNADLIHDIYFTFSLPDIYSNDNVDFKWVKNIGYNIIDKVSVYIGGSVIDEHYGEWFQIWNELTTPLDKKNLLNEMIGNVPEMYDPANAPGNHGIYPNASVQTGRINLNAGASIKKRVIRVPLIFWFNRNPSLALPLIALQYDPVQINITCRKITDLYTIKDIIPTSESYGSILKPQTTNTFYNSRYGIQNFVNEADMFTGVIGNRQLVNFSIDPYLDINYVYLDTKEMRNFAQTEHKYLIEQVRQSSFQGIVGSQTLDLQIHHPTSLMVIVCKRNDIEDRNDWNNYTNWVLEDVPPYGLGFENPYFNKYERNFKKGEVSYLSTVNKIAWEKANNVNYEIKKDKNCIKSISLNLDGTDRFTTQDPDFFNYLQSYSFSKTGPKAGIYPYSFSLDPFKFQPSGTCNMSRFNKIELNVETQVTPIPSEAVREGERLENLYKYDINVYTINYNILRVVSGMGNVEFSN